MGESFDLSRRNFQLLTFCKIQKNMVEGGLIAYNYNKKNLFKGKGLE